MISYMTFFLMASGAHCLLNTSRISKILANYDRELLLPPRKKGEVLNVRLSIVIQNMVPLRFLNNKIFVEMDIIMEWVDSRLRYKSNMADDRIVINKEKYIFFWRPDIMINGGNQAQEENFPKPLSTAWVFSNGSVIYATRIRATVACPMTLDGFPFDKQTCDIAFESSSYNRKTLQFQLAPYNGKTVALGEFFVISRFILENYKVEKAEIDKGMGGIFDQVKVIMKLKRDLNYYIMEYYLPVLGMVVLSFVSFWIHFKAKPARVALPCTVFLAMNSMVHHIRSSSGIFGAAEALEIFLNASIAFVVAVLIEYSVVGCTDKRWKRMNERKCKATKSPSAVNAKEQMKGGSIYTWVKMLDEKMMLKHIENEEEGHSLDKICRYLFPLSYLVFITSYLIYYTHG